MFIEKLFSSRVRKVIAWVVVSWLILGGVILVGIPAWRADRAFNDLSYGAIVDSIRLASGHRGHPYVLMNNEWRLFTIDEMKVVPILQVGDCLVKIPRSKTLRVYRKKGATYDLFKSLD